MPGRASALSQVPPPVVETHPIDDRFVPVRVPDLVAALAEAAGGAGGAAADLLALGDALIGAVDEETAAFQRRLSDEYAVFNPDRDTVCVHDEREHRRPADFACMNGRLEYLLDKANFQKLDDARIDLALRMASAHGIRVRLDPTRIENFAIFVRGQGRVPVRIRTLRNWRNGETVQVPVYRRLVVVARLRDNPHILLKMFKDIPEADVEALLPHAEAEMTWRDRVLMLGGGAGAVGSTATKVFSTGLFALSRLLWVVLMGACMLLYRTFTGYRRAKISRDWQRTRHLYYQNLSNNVGVIASLLLMIAHEEVKEALLAYGLCLLRPGSIRSEVELRRAIEEFVGTRFGAKVNFDIDDAIESLDRFDLWADRAAFRVRPPADAAALLREYRRSSRPAEYHGDMCDRRRPSAEQQHGREAAGGAKTQARPV